MSEIHNQREIEYLQSEITRLEHEKRSASLDWMAAAGQYEDEIARLRFENAKLLEEAEYELMYGYDMASADYRDIVFQQHREIAKLREALEWAAVQLGNNNLPAFAHQVRAVLGGEND